jgi:hypothetical protein
VGRWNRLTWAGAYDYVGQADYANSIQLAYLVSQQFQTKLRIPRSVPVLSFTIPCLLDISRLKFNCHIRYCDPLTRSI